MTKTLRCPACDATGEFPVVEHFDGYHMLRCDRCALEFSDPMKAGSAQWYADAYTLRHAALDRRIRDYFKWALKALPHTVKKGKLIDIGCGEGVFVEYARSQGFDATGIDFSANAIETGRRLLGTNHISVGSLAALRQQPDFQPFAAITFFEVLEHLSDPSAFLKDVWDALAPEGYVVLSVPARDYWPMKDENAHPPHHLTRWTPDALRALFGKNGFVIEHIAQGARFQSFRFFLSYWIRRAVYTLAGIRFRSPELQTARTKPRAVLGNPWVQKIFSALRPRELLAIALFPVAVVIFPMFARHFRGYNYFLLAHKKTT